MSESERERERERERASDMCIYYTFLPNINLLYRI